MAFDPTKIGTEFSYVDRQITTPVALPTSLMLYNPYRVAFIFSPLTLTAIIRPINAAATQFGMQVTGNTQPTVFSLATHGPIVQQAWSVIVQAGGIVYICEVLWQPPGGNP